ncbi:MAG TPA: aromatic ring-hydroxylating dioxygenase subunit alpha [Stellaceae bacterium]|nr:aromatic ring-hydroxylating dioxygenase subunit alpha [Stellaceae bacterium]
MAGTQTTDPSDPAAPLREMWYYAFPAARLKPGKMLSRLYLGEPVLFARTRAGVAFALRDVCPHRAMPLHYGRFDGAEVECPYHGWRFDAQGLCRLIPSLTRDRSFDLSRAGVRTYPVQEVQGNLWIFFGSDADAAPPVPILPGLDAGCTPDLTYSVRIPGPLDAAVFNLVDPTHNPFIHVSWWWRKRGSIHDKSKSFAPSPFGFTMLPHPPSANYAPYRLLGREVETEIVFRLPSTRIEHVRFGRHRFVTLNTITPIDADHVEESYAAYWNTPVLTALKPAGRWIVRSFAAQDGGAVRRQGGGLRYRPPLMLIDDGDTQAKWYYRLKREYARACAEQRAFINPVAPQVLRFRS